MGNNDGEFDVPGKLPTFGNVKKRQPVNIKFQNIIYTVPSDKGKKDILKSVSGEYRSGELTAIMGSSGAGKSSLMNILAGFKTKVKGDILVNNVKRDLNKFRKMSCYIMQMDELCPYLSVMEAMRLAADLKVGNHLSTSEKHQLVNEILETIGLSHASNTRTSCLSGGQKKRLAIALELVNNPPILFFDEPTSGLDSSSCLQCISLMKSLARGGRTVICVIHQPSSSIFAMFDKLYMMADGQCIYDGPTSSMVNFFSSSIGLVCPNHHNPADFAIDVAVGKYGYVVDKLAEATKNAKLSVSEKENDEKSSTESVVLDVQTKDGNASVAISCDTELLDNSLEEEVVFTDFGSSFWTQFGLLYKRALTCTIRDMTLTHLRLAIHIIVGLLVGMLYFGIGNEATKVFNNIGQHFFNMLVLLFTGIMATILTFPLDMPVLIREHLNNWYSLKAYYLAKCAADLPFEIIYPSVYVVIVYFMTDQPYEISRFFMYLTAGIMNSVVAQSVGLAIGIAFEMDTAIFMGPVSLAPPLLFAGFLVSFKTMPIYLRWLSYGVYLKYSFEGALQSIYGYNREKLHCSEPYCIYKSPETILTDFDVAESVFWINMVALGVYCVVVRLIAFFLLWRKINARH